MSIRKIEFVKGEYYHIYNRGNSKQVIFHDNNDYTRLLKLLFLSNGENNFKIDNIAQDVFGFDRGEPLVSMGAYCFMPNHFHILLTQEQPGGISKFMQKVSTGYAMYYNKKYERTGGLFEGKFKSKYVGDDSYLKYLFSYIHLNPLKLIDPNWKENGVQDKNRAIDFISNYIFSSCQDYMGYKREQNKLINIKSFPDYFSKHDLFKKEIFEWTTYRQDL